MFARFLNTLNPTQLSTIFTAVEKYTLKRASFEGNIQYTGKLNVFFIFKENRVSTTRS